MKLKFLFALAIFVVVSNSNLTIGYTMKSFNIWNEHDQKRNTREEKKLNKMRSDGMR